MALGTTALPVLQDSQLLWYAAGSRSQHGSVILVYGWGSAFRATLAKAQSTRSDEATTVYTAAAGVSRSALRSAINSDDTGTSNILSELRTSKAGMVRAVNGCGLQESMPSYADYRRRPQADDAANSVSLQSTQKSYSEIWSKFSKFSRSKNVPTDERAGPPFIVLDLTIMSQFHEGGL